MTTQAAGDFSKSLGIVWVDSPYPLVSIGLAQALEGEAQVRIGREPPEGEPSVVILGTGGVEGLLEGIKRVRRQNAGALVIVCGLYLDLAAAAAALRAGARGYIHAGMQPEQIRRAVEVAAEGELVAPRQLLEYLISENPAYENSASPDILSNRQREILDLAGEGMTNAQIAKRLFLTESTVKQHLRAAYKALGVSNRTEAIRLLRNDAQSDS